MCHKCRKNERATAINHLLMQNYPWAQTRGENRDERDYERY